MLVNANCTKLKFQFLCIDFYHYSVNLHLYFVGSSELENLYISVPEATSCRLNYQFHKKYQNVMIKWDITFALYSGDPGFKSCHGDQLF